MAEALQNGLRSKMTHPCGLFWSYSKVSAVFLHLASTNFVGRQYNTWSGKNKARNDEPRNIISDRNICSYSAASLRVLAAVD